MSEKHKHYLEYQKKWREKNPEYRRQYYLSHRDQEKKKNMEWRQRHIEQWRQYMRENFRSEYRSEYYRQWIIRNRDRKNWHTRKRKALKMNAEGTHSKEEWEKLKKRYNFTCPACGRKEPEIKLDHISPICYNDNICHIKTHKKRRNTTNYIIKTIKKGLDCLVENGERKIPKEQVLFVKNTEMPIRKKDILLVRNGEQIILKKYENNIEKIPKFALMEV